MSTFSILIFFLSTACLVFFWLFTDHFFYLVIFFLMIYFFVYLFICFFVHCMSCIRSSYLRTPFLAFHLFLLIYLSIYLFVLYFWSIYLCIYCWCICHSLFFFNQHLDVLFSYCCPLGLQEYKYIYTNWKRFFTINLTTKHNVTKLFLYLHTYLKIYKM